MNSEMLKIFDKNYNFLGTETRKEVHKFGYWHETFHCWFIFKNKPDGEYYIIFQIRSDDKRDFPNLLDITAAGHITESETVVEGIREIEEELGISVFYKDLYKLGCIKDEIIQESFIDRELANVFIYIIEKNLINEFQLQKEEVSGIVYLKLSSFCELWNAKIEETLALGYIMESEQKISFKKNIKKDSFLPHNHNYIQSVLNLINAKLSIM